VKPLRVAMVAPPWYPVPPLGYGGIERIVHLLASGLSARGHSVTVFGAEGTTSGDDVRVRAPRAWSTDMGTWIHKHTYLARVHRELAVERFDVLHDHTGSEGILAGALSGGAPVVATVHEPVGPAEAAFLAEVDDRVGLVALSEAQRAAAPGVRWAATVPNAVGPEDLLPLDELPARDAGYLVHLARMDESKGQHLAIEVARRAGLPLVLAGKVDAIPECEAYFRDRVAPHVDGERVRWLPEVRGRDKARLLAEARAMVFPLQWEEPFGLAVAEAMANGTPVVAFPRGAMPELVEPGETGVLVGDVSEMADAVADLSWVDRKACAERERIRFSVDRLLDGYEQIYGEVAGRGVVGPP
jgi:glycosyltransferase involved in cell wall biosynthesis